MAEIRIKNVPEELKVLLRAEAKRLGMDVRAVALFRLWGAASAPHTGAARNHLKTPREKFTPPTVELAHAEIVAKGYHISASEFVAYYATRGWKLKSGPMKDWKAAMVTWEQNWLERNPQMVIAEPPAEVKCEMCWDEGLVQQAPDVPGPRLIKCPKCGGKEAA